MRKNTTLRFSALLLVLALVTSCFVGGTFAKYTTSATGTVSARVANWGFEGASSITLGNLFSGTYESETYPNPTVKNANGEPLIAPGTRGSTTFQFAYDGSAMNAPEVAYKFTVSTDGSECSIAPGVLVWKLDNELCGNDGTFAELLTAIEALSGADDGSDSKDYAPGELPAAFNTIGESHTISWEWAYDTDPAGTNDARDTGLGNANIRDDVTVQITITATQID